MSKKNIEEDTEGLAKYAKESLRLETNSNLNEAERLLSHYEQGKISPDLIPITIERVSKEKIFKYLEKAKIPYQELKGHRVSVEEYETRIKSIEEKLK